MNKSVFQVVFEQMQELLRMTEGRQPKDGPVPPDIKKRVADLEVAVQEFKVLSDKLLQLLKATPEELAQVNKPPPTHLRQEDKETLLLGQELYQEASRKYAHMTALLQAVRDRGDINLVTGQQISQGIARKKKFGRLGGGRNDWLPM